MDMYGKNIKLPRHIYIISLLLFVSIPYSNGVLYGIISFPFVITVPELLVFLLVIIISAYFINRKSIIFPGTFFVDLLLGIALVFSILASSFINESGVGRIIGRLIWLYVLYAAILFLAAYSDDLTLLAQMIVAAAVAAAIVAIGQSLFDVFLNIGRPLGGRGIKGFDFQVGRAAGPYSVYGRYGMLLLIPLPALIYSFLSNSGRRIFRSNVLTTFSAVTIVMGIVVSQSRVTWILAAVAVSIVYTIHIHTNYRSSKFFRRFALLLLSYTVFLVGYVLFAILSVGLGNLMSRFEANFISFQLFMKNPVFGTGFGSFSRLAPRYGVDIVVHNIIFETAVVAGIFGVSILLLLLIRSIVRGLRVIVFSKHLADFSVMLLIGCIIALGETLFFRGLYSEEFWMVLAIMSGIYYCSFEPVIN